MSRTVPRFIWILAVTGVALALAGCATAPQGTYFPALDRPDSLKVSHALYRAALAAGDSPSRYSFALVASEEANAYSAPDATFYVTDGLARLPAPVVEAMLAHEVAHEVLGHAGKKRALQLSISGAFTALGILIPGVGLADFVVNPLVVRAFGRDQEKEADLKAVEILRAMGNPTARRSLWLALQAVAEVNKGKEPAGLLAIHPPLKERLAALEPLEPPASPLAQAQPL